MNIYKHFLLTLIIALQVSTVSVVRAQDDDDDPFEIGVPALFAGAGIALYFNTDFPVATNVLDNEITVAGKAIGTDVFSGFAELDDMDVLISIILDDGGEFDSGAISLISLRNGQDIAVGPVDSFIIEIVDEITGGDDGGVEIGDIGDVDELDEQIIQLTMTADVTGDVEGELNIIYRGLVEAEELEFTRVVDTFWRTKAGPLAIYMVLPDDG